MKHRLIVLLCAVALLGCLVFPAFAATPDLAGMTDDEIVALLEQVNAEVVSRGIRKTATLPQGTYIAGRDIPVGRYVFTCMAKGDDWGNVTVTAEGGKGSQLLWEVMLAPQDGEEPECCFMSLQDGDELESGIPFSLTIMGGVLFK